MPSLSRRETVDDAMLAYVEWREECMAVWDSHGWWASGAVEDTRGAHAAYRAALDREEAAANWYAKLIERVGELVPAGTDCPVSPSGFR
jgi:hypothetical protein